MIFDFLPKDLIQLVAKYLNYFHDIPTFRQVVPELVFTYKNRVSIKEIYKDDFLNSIKIYWDDVLVQEDHFYLNGALFSREIIRQNYRICKTWSSGLVSSNKLIIFEHSYDNYYEYKSYSDDGSINQEVIRYGSDPNPSVAISTNYDNNTNISSYSATTNGYLARIFPGVLVTLSICSVDNLPSEDTYRRYSWQDKILFQTSQYENFEIEGRYWNFNIETNYERTVYYKEGQRISGIFDYYRDQKRVQIRTLIDKEINIENIDASLGYDFYLDPEKKLKDRIC